MDATQKRDTTKMSKWIRFIEIEKKPKTLVYKVYPKLSLEGIGVIKWYPQWRHYCFFPTTQFENYCFFPTTQFETVYSDRCLTEIAECITQLNKEHKEGRHNNE